ncbi:MAG: PAS domain S-box protein [Bacteroidota bacterium]
MNTDTFFQAGLLVFQNNGTITKLDTGLASFLGYEKEALAGKNLSLIFPSINEQINFSSHSEDIVIKTEGLKKHGETFPASMTISSLEAHSAEKTAIIQDLSALQNSEHVQAEIQTKLNAIINTAVDGIISIDTTGTIQLVNPAAARLFGYDAAELTGKNVNILMPEPDQSRHDQYMQNYLSGGKPKIIGIGREVSGMKKNGTVFPFRLSISEVKLVGGRVFTGIVHDLTSEKIAEEQLRRYATELERSNRELEDFAYISSHDLQEPLRKIQAFGSRLRQKEGSSLTEKGQNYLDRMLNASERLQNLINDLLTFSRVSTKASPFQQVSLTEILEEVLSDLEYSIEKAQAKIHYEVLPEIEADPTQMRQLFQNLIGNSLKFRKEEQASVITISSRTYYKQERMVGMPGDEVMEVTIQDNGIGFNTQYAEKIFAIFQQLEGHTYAGSGIGLAICKKIVSRHGGTIRAESGPEGGATFTFRLPSRQHR